MDAVLAGVETVAPIEQAHRTITIAHLGNIAIDLGRDLRWNPERETVPDDAKAAELLDRPYRAPWRKEG